MAEREQGIIRSADFTENSHSAPKSANSVEQNPPADFKDIATIEEASQALHDIVFEYEMARKTPEADREKRIKLAEFYTLVPEMIQNGLDQETEVKVNGTNLTVGQLSRHKAEEAAKTELNRLRKLKEEKEAQEKEEKKKEKEAKKASPSKKSVDARLREIYEQRQKAQMRRGTPPKKIH